MKLLIWRLFIAGLFICLIPNCIVLEKRVQRLEAQLAELRNIQNFGAKTTLIGAQTLQTIALEIRRRIEAIESRLPDTNGARSNSWVIGHVQANGETHEIMLPIGALDK